MLIDCLYLCGGVAAGGIGGDIFVRGSVRIARWAKVSAAIVGATVAAFATSSPELAVGINAAIEGHPGISLGDTLGSNVGNVGLILGLGLLIAAIPCRRDTITRDFPIALACPLLIGLLALDGRLSRLDGLVLLCAFGAWLAATLRDARRQRSSDNGANAGGGWLAALQCIGGLALLTLSGRLIVVGATAMATGFGISPFVIGATVVAIGTSVPELATTLVSQMRGHHEIGLGTILGSNIFNGLFIVGVVAMICPIELDRHAVMSALALGIAALALTWPPASGVIRRRRGVLLLAVHAVYLFVIRRH